MVADFWGFGFGCDCLLYMGFGIFCFEICYFLGVGVHVSPCCLGV